MVFGKHKTVFTELTLLLLEWLEAINFLNPRFSWAHRASSECSVTCGGGGRQFVSWVCRDSRYDYNTLQGWHVTPALSDNTIVDSDLCDDNIRPRGRDTVECGTQACGDTERPGLRWGVGHLDSEIILQSVLSQDNIAVMSVWAKIILQSVSVYILGSGKQSCLSN